MADEVAATISPVLHQVLQQLEQKLKNLYYINVSVLFFHARYPKCVLLPTSGQLSMIVILLRYEFEL